jgi:hypothetical protein
MSWRYIAASVVGTSHVGQVLPCQDACLAATVDEDLLLLVASDGAGSAAFSHEGSRITCDTLLEEATRHVQCGGNVASLDSNTLDLWLEAVVRRLHIQAAARDVGVRELACTLLLALLGPNASAFVHLGDGGIVAWRDGDYVPVTWPSGGEYANTTFFLTDDNALDRLQVQLAAPPVDEIALFSDGLQMLALQYDTHRAHTPFFRPMFARLRAEGPGESVALTGLLAEYLGSPVINKRTDDDKTLVLATRLPPG